MNVLYVYTLMLLCTYVHVWSHFRFAQWFAHHLSNWKFEWEWDKWSSVLQLPAQDHPKVRFIKEVLAKCLRSVEVPLQKRAYTHTHCTHIHVHLNTVAYSGFI